MAASKNLLDLWDWLKDTMIGLDLELVKECIGEPDF